MKIVLDNPITHDGKEYGRGTHTVDDALAKLWLKNAPHAVSLPVQPEVGNVAAAPDANQPAKVEAISDLSLLELNVEDAKSLILETKDPVKLAALAEGEKLHPKWAGGRKSVLDAIAERTAVLKIL